MKCISTLALGVSLAFGCAIPASPAVAQKKVEPAAAQATVTPSKGAHKAILALDAAQKANDAAAYAAALSAAQAVAKTPEDRYAIGRIQFDKALAANDQAGQVVGVEAMVASNVGTPENRARLLSGLATLYKNTNNLDQAAATTEKLIALNPANTDPLWQLADIRVSQKRPADAVLLAEQAIKAAQAAGAAPDPKAYRYALNLAYENKLQAQSVKLARNLFGVSTAPADRRNALVIYRQNASLDDEGEMDLFRLMRAAKAMDHQGDYYALASALARGNYHAEAQAVANEAVAANKPAPAGSSFAAIASTAGAKIAEDKAALPALATRARADARGDLAFKIANGYLGHGDYATAAELYRVAVQKGTADADLANTRLGIALAMGGQAAEAEAAFKAVKGQRAGVADYWLAWLASRG